VELLPHLARRAEVQVMAPPDWQGGAEIAGVPVLPTQLPPEGFTPLLHLGNNPYHLWIARYLRAHGGFVVLHDTVLHHLLVEEAASDGAWERFGSELEAAHGEAGAALARGRTWGMHGPRDPFLFPARSVYLRHARGVIVHSQRGLQDVRRDCPELPARRVPLSLGALPAGDRDHWRRRLGAVAGELVLAHLGFLTPAKGLDVILRAVLALGQLGIPVRLVVVGEGSEKDAFRDSVGRAGLGERVRIWGFASEEDLGGLLAATDIGLVPRFPTAGETSAAALRFMAAGVPVAVSGYRQFLELPESAAFRLTPGAAGAVDLVRVVAWLAHDPGVLAAARAAARRCWEDGGHPPEQAAGALVAALEELRRELA
jgi:glycosyltransferase involved in cell wall biosynthesis